MNLTSSKTKHEPRSPSQESEFVVSLTNPVQLDDVKFHALMEATVMFLSENSRNFITEYTEKIKSFGIDKLPAGVAISAPDQDLSCTFPWELSYSALRFAFDLMMEVEDGSRPFGPVLSLPPLVRWPAHLDENLRVVSGYNMLVDEFSRLQETMERWEGNFPEFSITPEVHVELSLDGQTIQLFPALVPLYLLGLKQILVFALGFDVQQKMSAA